MFPELLAAKLRGIAALSPAQVTGLQRHYDLLVRWNEVLNLTTVHGAEQLVERHYGESIFAGTHLPPGELVIADVGSGGGFPGLPVAVLRSECRITLIESHQRKAVFLREASRELPNVTVIASRAEAVTERFDWCLCRAVKFAEIGRILAKLAPNCSVLAGEENPGKAGGFVWAPPIPLPWGDRRFLWMGSRC